jgi:hypothetical protein
MLLFSPMHPGWSFRFAALLAHASWEIKSDNFCVLLQKKVYIFAGDF